MTKNKKPRNERKGRLHTKHHHKPKSAQVKLNKPFPLAGMNLSENIKQFEEIQCLIDNQEGVIGRLTDLISKVQSANSVEEVINQLNKITGEITSTSTEDNLFFKSNLLIYCYI